MIRFINIFGMLKLQEKFNSSVSSVFGIASCFAGEIYLSIRCNKTCFGCES